MRKLLKYAGWLSLLAVALLLFAPFPAFAGYLTYITITVTDNSTTAYTYLPVIVDINSTQLANLGNIDLDGLYTNVFEASTNRTYMVGTSKLLILTPSISGGQAISYTYALNNTPAKTRFPIMVGVGGNITASNSTSLHLADNFTIDMYGYFDTSAGAGKNLVSKASAVKLYVGGTSNITAEILGGTVASTSALSVASGYHRVYMSANTTDLGIWIDSVFVNSTTLGGASVPDNANDWTFVEATSVPYADNITISTNLTQRLRYAPVTMVSPTNVVDETGNSNTGTINWGTNPTGVNVTLGALTSGGTYTLPGTITPPSIPGPLPSGGMIESTEEPTGMPNYDSFAMAASALGWTTRVLYGVAILITAVVMGFGVMVATGSIFGGAIMAVVLMGAGAATGTLPAWIAVAALLTLIFFTYVSVRA